VALQQTTRELWAQQGPFEPYTIHGVPQQNIPDIYIKGAVWNAQADPPRYVAQSSAPEESGTGTWFPVDFNEEHVCWVEVRLQEPAGSEAYWQAFRIAGQDLGLDITQGDVETHLQATTLHSYRESMASSHSSRASTPSVASIIRPRPSPYQPGSRDQEIAHSLAESLNINDPMSNTLTMEVPAGTINPVTGHVDADEAALFRAIGPDQPDPPSVGGTDHTTHVPFGWIRPQSGRMPEPRRYIYGGGGPPGGGPKEVLREDHSDHQEDHSDHQEEDRQAEALRYLFLQPLLWEEEATSWWETHHSYSKGNAVEPRNSSPNGNYTKESTSQMT
jgi:hypothetical protein